MPHGNLVRHEILISDNVQLSRIFTFKLHPSNCQIKLAADLKSLALAGRATKSGTETLAAVIITRNFPLMSILAMAPKNTCVSGYLFGKTVRRQWDCG